jgi:hypothetical protein
MWKNSERCLQHCLYFDFPVCVLLWLKKIGGKTFRFALVHNNKLCCDKSIINIKVGEIGNAEDLSTRTTQRSQLTYHKYVQHERNDHIYPMQCVTYRKLAVRQPQHFIGP